MELPPSTRLELVAFLTQGALPVVDHVQLSPLATGVQLHEALVAVLKERKRERKKEEKSWLPDGYSQILDCMCLSLRA